MEIGRRGIMANEHMTVGSNSYEKVKIFKYFGSLLISQNSIHEEVKCRLKAGNECIMESKHFYLLDFSLGSKSYEKVKTFKYLGYL